MPSSQSHPPEKTIALQGPEVVSLPYSTTAGEYPKEMASELKIAMDYRGLPVALGHLHLKSRELRRILLTPSSGAGLVVPQDQNYAQERQPSPAFLHSFPHLSISIF